ncbi:peptidylprolyl isomerase [Wenyingzhuangia sp. 1_MG-2023]|nr:peptidylprolyl isomerase [Wenyingzhuangia sp. 1_MG-2023]
MLELLNKYRFRFSFPVVWVSMFLLLCLHSCGSKENKPAPAIKPSKQIEQPKKVEPPKVVEKKQKTPPKTVTVPENEILIKDIISQKNVRQFFLNYGRKNPETKLLLKTRHGNMNITLYKETPLHRASFIYLIKNGYYNKTCFHRIVKDFIIQGGWSEQTIVSTYRTQLNNYRIPAEFRKNVVHKRGALSATRRWVENPYKMSNPFEFFIVQTNVDCSHLNGEHTVFGQVTKGFDVIDKIANETLDGNSEWPEVDVNIEFEILE